MGWRSCASCSAEELDQRRRTVRAAAAHASWDQFFQLYRQAYDMANEKAHARRFASSHKSSTISKELSMRPSSIPFLRTLNAVSELPAELSRLRDLANNVWWCWQPEALSLFKGMDPEL